MSKNEAKKTISLWKNSNSEFIARVDRKTGKTQQLAHHANHVSALMALYTDWPEMAHAINHSRLKIPSNWKSPRQTVFRRRLCSRRISRKEKRRSGPLEDRGVCPWIFSAFRYNSFCDESHEYHCTEASTDPPQEGAFAPSFFV